jgi:hypothetical protein
MNLELPVIGTTPDPTWSQEFLDNFNILDVHNHTPGLGVQIPTAGIAINADFPFNSYNATLLRSARFNNQSAPLSLLTDIGCLYVNGGDLWYNSSSGQQVQITSGTGVNVSGTGGFKGDYVTSNAVAYFNNTSNLFYYTNSSGVYSNSQVGQLLLTNGTSNIVALSANPASASNYTITLPSSLPASPKILNISSTGSLGYYDADNSTLQIAANLLQVKPLGITAAQIANNTITTNQISNSAGITNVQLAATNYAISSAVTVSTSTFNTPVNILVADITLTCSGNRLVVVQLLPGAGFGPSGLRLTANGSGGNVRANYHILVDGIDTNESILITSGYLAASEYCDFPVDSAFGIIATSAGAHTFNISMTMNNAQPGAASASSIAANGVKLFVYEI